VSWGTLEETIENPLWNMMETQWEETPPKKTKTKIPPNPLPKNPKGKTNLSPISVCAKPTHWPSLEVRKLIKWWVHIFKKVL
jgi:hypothetical protein